MFDLTTSEAIKHHVDEIGVLMYTKFRVPHKLPIIYWCIGDPIYAISWSLSGAANATYLKDCAFLWYVPDIVDCRQFLCTGRWRRLIIDQGFWSWIPIYTSWRTWVAECTSSSGYAYIYCHNIIITISWKYRSIPWRIQLSPCQSTTWTHICRTEMMILSIVFSSWSIDSLGNIQTNKYHQVALIREPI